MRKKSLSFSVATTTINFTAEEAAEDLLYQLFSKYREKDFFDSDVAYNLSLKKSVTLKFPVIRSSKKEQVNHVISDKVLGKGGFGVVKASLCQFRVSHDKKSCIREKTNDVIKIQQTKKEKVRDRVKLEAMQLNAQYKVHAVVFHGKHCFFATYF